MGKINLGTWQGGSAAEERSLSVTHVGEKRLKVDGGLEINAVYFADVSRAVLRPHKIAY